jgi:hypothetical protein
MINETGDYDNYYEQNNSNNELKYFDNQNINTQYTNKKDIKYKNNDNYIKPINFDIIDNTFSNNNMNYSFI